MSRSRRLQALAVLAIAAVAISCSHDGITAPRSDAPAMSFDQWGSTGTGWGDHDRGSRWDRGDVWSGHSQTGLRLLTCRVAQTTFGSERIGPSGGVLVVGPHRLVVPPGALDSSVTISAVAAAGTLVQVSFAPHGLRFERPVELSLSYRDCGQFNGNLGKIVYIDRYGDILETLFSVPDLARRTVVGSVRHFSRYAVAY